MQLNHLFLIYKVGETLLIDHQLIVLRLEVLFGIKLSKRCSFKIIFKSNSASQS